MMDKFTQVIAEITEVIWGLPMILLLLGGGIYLTFRLGFFKFSIFHIYLTKPLEKYLQK